MNGRKYLYLLVVLFLVAATSWLMIRKANRPEQPATSSQLDTAQMASAPSDTKGNSSTPNHQTQESDTTVAQLPSKKTIEIPGDMWSIHPKSAGYYAMPISGKVELSGSFGELRSNHFHAGLDIRTGGQEGMEVLAAASGYVSRIKVSAYGYGKAIYIQHPNGTTTVYGHLQRYAGVIQDAVLSRQYKLESYEIDWYPAANELKVTKGDVIAYSGNTGGSGGPHLHFEIRNARGEASNPLLQGIVLEDQIPPSFRGLQVLKLDEEIRRTTGSFPFKTLTSNTAEITLEPGTYGLGARWLEYFTDRMNYLGINYASMVINGKLVYRQQIESFAFDDSRFINHHINFVHFLSTGQRYTKFFKDSGNGLPFYSGDGRINLNNGDTLNATLIIRDIAGGADTTTLRLIGKADTHTSFKTFPAFSGTAVSASSGATLKTDAATIILPPSSLYTNSIIELSESETKADLASPMIHVHTPMIPLHKRMTVRIKPKAAFSDQLNKLVVMEYDRASRNSKPYETSHSGGMAEASVKNFGIYYLKLDTIPPRVRFSSSGRTLVAYISDAAGDISTYRGTLDGKWILFEYEPKSGRLKAVVPSSIEKGNHSLKLRVSDLVGNETVIEKTVSF
ncbi:MAG: M23 family metallopeptidase [Bacteroidetes bacterium]|nr:M23 family metallopeptidase [Bacteroidota bacterium]